MVGWMAFSAEPVDLVGLCAEVVARTRAAYPDEKLGSEDVALTVGLIDREAGSVDFGDAAGEVSMYPASLVKTFFLAFAGHLLDEGALTVSDEAERACRDMIVDSSNDATGYVVDWTCGTTPGPELDAAGLAEFGRKREAANRWFKSLGYRRVNAVQRTYNEGPYGRERQWVGESFTNRNMLTSNACARLMADIALDKHWSKERGEWMRGLLRRANPADEPEMADAQARAYVGKVIPSRTILYSKAGWTSQVRHDMAWLVMPDGREVVIVPFTKRGGNATMVSFMAAEVLRGLGYSPRDPMVAVSEED